MHDLRGEPTMARNEKRSNSNMWPSLVEFKMVGKGVKALLGIVKDSNGYVEELTVSFSGLVTKYDASVGAFTITNNESFGMTFHADVNMKKKFYEIYAEWTDTLPEVDPIYTMEVTSAVAKKAIEDHLKVYTQTLMKLTDSLHRADLALVGVEGIANKCKDVRQQVEDMYAMFTPTEERGNG